MLNVIIGEGVRVRVVKEESVMPRYCGLGSELGEGRMEMEVVRTTTA